jgi:hypothetical protein
MKSPDARPRRHALAGSVKWLVGSALCLFLLAIFGGNASATFTSHQAYLIAFERAGDIYVMTKDGQNAADLTPNSASVDSHPSFGVCPSIVKPDPAAALDCSDDIHERCGPDQSTGPPVPSSHVVVFESQIGQDADLVRLRFSGTGLTAPPTVVERAILTPTQFNDRAPAVGPNDVVAFTRGPDGARDIWAMRANGTGASQLTDTPSVDEANPDWSGDTRLIFDTNEGGARHLAVININNNASDPSDPTPFTAGPAIPIGQDAQPRFDPSWLAPIDGIKGDSGSRILHVTTVAGQDYLDFFEEPFHGPIPDFSDPLLVRPLTGDPGEDGAPSWGGEPWAPGTDVPPPLGEAVVFQSTRAEPGNIDVYRMAADGSAITRLTTDPAPDRDPSWEALTPGACLQPDPYGPRPGPVSRTGKPPGNGGAGGGGTETENSGASGGATQNASQSQKPSSPAPKRPPRRFTASIARIRVTGHGRRRTVLIRLRLNASASVRARLTTRRRIVASRRWRLDAGSHLLHLRVRAKAASASYRLRVVVRPTSGHTRSFARRVRLPR